MQCSKCGHQNLEDARFCSSCGAVTVASVAEPKSVSQIEAETDSGEATLSIAVVESADADSTISSTPAGFIRVLRGPNAGSKFALNLGSLEVGRHPASGVFLDDITVSRRHCVFNCVAVGSSGDSGTAISVTDVGSLNGTYVNRKLITTSDLSDGDEVQIGRYVVVIELGR